MSERMTKADRNELKTIIGRRTKANKADAAARVEELRSEAVRRLTEGWEAENHAREELNRAIIRLADDANKAAKELVAEFKQAWPTSEPLTRGARGEYIGTFPLYYDTDRRSHQQRLIDAELKAMLAAANEKLERSELQLREALLRDTLDTQAARDFLDRIPSVGELVPMSRIEAALEAGLEMDE
jgi:hypothetical protein